MKIPFGTITITQKAKDLIAEALETGRVSSGRLVRQLEDRFAELTGTKAAVALSSGTDADALALAVLYDFGAKPEDEVILPALSFVATGNAVLQAGFTPVFVDIERETLNINPGRIEEAVTDRTAAIMPVHLMGKPAEMDTINDIAKAHDLFVIEDAAEAHGAVYKGRNVGTLGHMAAFSLYVAHIITAIEGGIVTTNRAEFAEVLRSLRSHGRACKCKQCVINVDETECKKRFAHGTDIRFVVERMGFSCKMNELEAAIGIGSRERYDPIVSRRHDNLVAMIDGLQEFAPHLTTFREEPHETIGPHALPVLVAEDAPFTRDEIVQHLESAGIDSRNLFLSMPTQCPQFARFGGKLGDFPEAEYVGNCGFHVGVHQDIGPEQIDYFLQTLRQFLSQHGAS